MAHNFYRTGSTPSWPITFIGDEPQRGVGEDFSHASGVTANKVQRHSDRAPMGRSDSDDRFDSFTAQLVHSQWSIADSGRKIVRVF